MVDFATAIERVLTAEGVYVDDPDDPGGETKWGISRRSYPELDIKNLTRADAKAIYFRDFWTPVASKINDNALVFQMLDAAVHHGMGNATRFLQRAVRVADDGHFGPVSLAAFRRMDIRDVHLRFMAARFRFWAKLKKFDAFGRGWVNRGADDLDYLAEDN